MRYKITEKIVYCELRCSSQGNVFNCLECKKHVGEIGEKTKILTEKQYLDLLKGGNTFITKVELISDDVKTYKGTLVDEKDWPISPECGDVYFVTGDFKHDGREFNKCDIVEFIDNKQYYKIGSLW